MTISPELRGLVNQYWLGDETARLILADACEQMGRYDIAMLWRDELPSYRRRKRVNTLTVAELDQVTANMQWWNTNVVLKTGATDELLALAAISCLYRAAASRQPINALPQVIWRPSPLHTKRQAPRDNDLLEAEPIWKARPYLEHSVSAPIISAIRHIIDQTFSYSPHHFTSDAAAYGNNTNLSHGLAYGQFDADIGYMATTSDILRLSIKPVEELSQRAVIALARCSPYWNAFPNVVVLSQHPTFFDPNPRWAWIDSDAQPHQWPTTH